MPRRQAVAGRSERRESEQSSGAVAWGARIASHVRRAGCRVARLTGNGVFRSL